MKVGWKNTGTSAVVLALLTLGLLAAPVVAAEEYGFTPRNEVSISGGIQALNENDTALPDQLITIPAVATVTHYFAPNLAAEGEFTWMIPVEQNVDLGSGLQGDRKSPDVLAYQANLRYDLPVAAWSPYLVAGAGAMTFLSDTGANRVPRLGESQTAFAINFGAGVSYGLGPRWALRADAREFVAFPSNDAAGLSDSSGADNIWMERGTVGLSYRF